MRKTAELKLAQMSEQKAVSRSTEVLLHELQVHQIELEMQNEALRDVQIALEESRDRYVELYDFAPVGYLTLSRNGLIGKINLTGAALLGADRAKISHRNFAFFVSKKDRDSWHSHLLNVLKNDDPHTFELALQRDDGAGFYGRLECQRFQQACDGAVVRIALTDITQRHFADEKLRESEELLRGSHIIAGLGSYVLDVTTGRWISTGMLDELLGIDESYERTIDGWVSLLHPDDRRMMTDYLKKEVIGKGVVFDKEYRIIRPNDLTERWMHGMGKLEFDANGHPLKMLGTIQDITEYRLAQQHQRISAVAFQSQEGMVITDVAGTILQINKAYTSITGYTAEEVIGKNPRILQSGRQDASFYKEMWGAILNKGFWEGEIWNKRKNGEIFPEHLIITAVKNEHGKTTNYVGNLTDITLSREAVDEIKHLAYYDVLTRLPNRRLLLDRLKQALAASERSGRQGALLFIDLDDFKTLNDTLGHDIGDLLLQQVAHRLESCVREGDNVARLGGDEFVVMLENISEQTLEAATQTETIANKILHTLNQPYQLAAHEYRNTPSIGVTLFGNNYQSVEDLLKQADIAMYQAKKAGRNTMRFFDQQMQVNINERAALEKELNSALVNRQFQLYYQIQVDSKRRAVGAEALIRWEHPERGLVSPNQFIPLAEETGLILPIGKWVLESACAQLKAWQQNDLARHLTLSVNVSAKQFHEASFVSEVQAAVQLLGINPELLKLEPTESILLENIEEAIVTMNELKAIGVRFALDDFGTGFSSLQYLKKLPLNQLKIDQTFVRDLASDSSDQAIVRTIIAMAQSLNLEVIAEGVETEEQQQILQHNGCNHYQGYLFGRPMPIEEFEGSLRNA